MVWRTSPPYQFVIPAKAGIHFLQEHPAKLALDLIGGRGRHLFRDSLWERIIRFAPHACQPRLLFARQSGRTVVVSQFAKPGGS